MTTLATPERVAEPPRVHVPYRAGLPRLGAYLRTLWRRRAFAVELSRAELRAQQDLTVLGPLWLVVNPLLLAGVYFVLVDIVSGGDRGPAFFAHLAAGVFAFTLVQQSMQKGVKSVVAAGQLILNSEFPRALLPLSAVRSAVVRFLPTAPIYAGIHAAAGLPVGAALLWVPPLLALLVAAAAGLTMAVAAAQVYFRDLSSFLPYLLRAWLYASPVLYWAQDVPGSYEAILVVNPLAPILVALSDVLVSGTGPAAGDLALAVGWSGVLLGTGGLFYVSREREFPVRL
jgi:teichoic acid transport system permease protein